jgi:ATP-dependent DNA helicase RecG
MRLLGDRPEITSSELAAELGITGKGVEWQLSRLRTSGRIRRVGPDKGGHWEVVS